MEQTIINIQEKGIYLFGKNTRLSTQLKNELVVLLWDSQNCIAGLAYFDVQTKTADVSPMLGRLLEKILIKQGQNKSELIAKCFGSCYYRQNIIEEIKHWLQIQKIQAKAADLGKGSTRKLIVDCSNGRVGVSYSEAVQPPTSRHQKKQFGT